MTQRIYCIYICTHICFISTFSASPSAWPLSPQELVSLVSLCCTESLGTKPISTSIYESMADSQESHPGNKISSRAQTVKYRTGATPSRSQYWESLSKVWLTPRALQELDRRNKSGYQTISIPPALKEVFYPGPKRFARRGGPDINFLRGVCAPHLPYR